MKSRYVSRTKVAVWLVVLGLVLGNSAMAGFHNGNAVTMGGEPVFRIGSGAFGFSAEHRAWITQDRLDNALVLSADKSPSAVTVDGVVVLLGGRSIATADSASASMEGLTAPQLAERWAASIRNYLADSGNTSLYLASLTGKHPIDSKVAIMERRLYAAPGTTFTVNLSSLVSSETARAGDRVEATIVSDVAMGHQFVIPAGSIVLGQFKEVSPGALMISFDTIRTTAGSEIPIAAIVYDGLRTDSPHTVCTLAIPYGPGVDCRIPASIGVGAETGVQALVFRRGTNTQIAIGQPVTVIFEEPTQVAVVARPAL